MLTILIVVNRYIFLVFFVLFLGLDLKMLDNYCKSPLTIWPGCDSLIILAQL